MPSVPSVTMNGLMLQSRGEKAVDEAPERSRQQADDDAEQESAARLPSPCAEQSAHGENGANGKVDAAGDDDQRHPERHDVDHRCLPDHARQVGVGQEMRRRDGQRYKENDEGQKRQQPLDHC